MKNLTQKEEVRYVVIDGEKYSEKYTDIGHISNKKISNQVLKELELGAGHKRKQIRISSHALGRLVKELGAGGGLGSIKRKRKKIRKELHGESVCNESPFNKDDWFDILHELQKGGGE